MRRIALIATALALTVTTAAYAGDPDAAGIPDPVFFEASKLLGSALACQQPMNVATAGWGDRMLLAEEAVIAHSLLASSDLDRERADALIRRMELAAPRQPGFAGMRDNATVEVCREALKEVANELLATLPKP
jgi:hypothetical protein